MKNELLPGLDRAWAGLIGDLDQRGLLDETLVMCLSEHGRTPKLHNVSGGGRDHWSQVYSALFAGGGMAHGKVVGKSDKHAGTVVERPVSPKDILATLYHMMGIDPHIMLTDRSGRPLPLVPDGSVVTEMLA
jgi:arylsulfatase A-like enzyme